MGRNGSNDRAKKSITALRRKYDDDECDGCILTDEDVKKFFE